MRLTEKEFIKADGTVIKLTPEWISSKLGEVYELSCLDGNSRERLHYGYMTEALVSFLETTDEKGTPFFERVRLKHTDDSKNRVFNLLNQRVILDRPSNITTKSFYSNFHLWPTTYSDEKKIDDIVIKVQSYFSLCNKKGDLELYFNNNTVEIEGEDIQSIRESDIKDSIIYSRREEPISIEGEYLNGINGFDSELTEAKKEMAIPCSINKLEIL